MNTYLILLRGINVGGKNKIPMAQLRQSLEELGFTDVTTYIASGNVILKSDKSATETATTIEEVLPQKFDLDTDLIKVLALTREQLQSVIDNKPDDFGEYPKKYHSDAIFLIGISAQEAIEAFKPREGVDKVWAGDGVIYSQRLSTELTKSRLSVVIMSPLYKSMTIRSWNTTVKLLDLLNKASD